MKFAEDKRVSFSLYADDTKVLRRLNLALRDAGADVGRADAMRLLIYAASEAEMFSHAALRLQAEARGGADTGTIDERFTVWLPGSLIKKLGRVVDDLARKDIDVERTFIVRALLHAPHDAKALIRALPKLAVEFPDRRSLRGQQRG
ncbi:MAG: hypothetical protein WC378_03925 [Opitutaceae bacterium]